MPSRSTASRLAIVGNDGAHLASATAPNASYSEKCLRLQRQREIDTTPTMIFKRPRNVLTHAAHFYRATAALAQALSDDANMPLRGGDDDEPSASIRRDTISAVITDGSAAAAAETPTRRAGRFLTVVKLQHRKCTTLAA